MWLPWHMVQVAPRRGGDLPQCGSPRTSGSAAPRTEPENGNQPCPALTQGPLVLTLGGLCPTPRLKSHPWQVLGPVWKWSQEPPSALHPDPRIRGHGCREAFRGSWLAPRATLALTISLEVPASAGVVQRALQHKISIKKNSHSHAAFRVSQALGTGAKIDWRRSADNGVGRAELTRHTCSDRQRVLVVPQ